MTKLKSVFSVFLFCIFLSIPSFVFADSPKVYVRIESYDKTLASGEVSAESFSEAVQKIGKESSIPIIISQSKNKKLIYSVNNINNNFFSQNDSWLGFVIRNGKVIAQKDFLNTKLNSSDEVVLYYGDSTKTKVIPYLKEEKAMDKVTLYAVNNYVSWSTVDGKIFSNNVSEGIQNVRVHLKNSKGTEQIVFTDMTGKALFNIEKADWYSYYADGYNSIDLPSVVKTSERETILGLKNDEALTRGEFASLIIGKKQKSVINSNVTFDDIVSHKYEWEIKEAVSQGILSGYSDKIFEPDKNISVLEAACVISRFLPDETSFTKTENIPSWAQKGIYTAKKNGILDGINDKLTSPLSSAAFMKMINNMN